METIIGVIGGAGVAATNKLCELIEVQFTKNGATRDAHHPEMIIYQATRSPSRSMFLEGRGESFIPSYVAIGNKLKTAGATCLCMNCNTAHVAIDQIMQQIGLPFINLIVQMARCIKAKQYKRVGLMVSDGARKAKIYESYIDCEIVYPSLPMQEILTQGICGVKNNNRFLPIEAPLRPQNLFQQVTEHLYAQQVDMVVAGCTDIAVDYVRGNVLDSLTILAQAIIEQVQNSSERKLYAS